MAQNKTTPVHELPNEYTKIAVYSEGSIIGYIEHNAIASFQKSKKIIAQKQASSAIENPGQ